MTVVGDPVDPYIIDFEPGDCRDPQNFSKGKKWRMTAIACFFTLVASMAAGSYNMGFTSMIKDLQCTELQASLGLSVYALGFGVVAMLTVSFSEEFGRQRVYMVSLFGFSMMYMVIALSPNIQTVILGRFLQSAFGATGATMVAGTIADLWARDERGLPMSIFNVAVFAGIGLGPVIGGWIEMNPRLRWRWIQWIQFIISTTYWATFPLLMQETRSSVILMRIAKIRRQKTGDLRYRARVEQNRESLRTLIYISCTRPIYLLCREPIVASFSTWIGFAWGVTYGVIESVSGAFRDLHHFTDGEIGTVFASMVFASFLGFLSNLYQERLYLKHVAKKGPEARLYSACFAAVMLPAGMFIFAWCSFPSVHWFMLIIGFVIFMWATFLIFVAVCNYMADCYGPYASSAMAGQSLLRNLMATAFPLFTPKMFAVLGYPWASTVIALIAVVLVPIPFILFFFGPSIRGRSKFSKSVTTPESAS